MHAFHRSLHVHRARILLPGCWVDVVAFCVRTEAFEPVVGPPEVFAGPRFLGAIHWHSPVSGACHVVYGVAAACARGFADGESRGRPAGWDDGLVAARVARVALLVHVVGVLARGARGAGGASSGSC